MYVYMYINIHIYLFTDLDRDAGIDLFILTSSIVGCQDLYNLIKLPPFSIKVVCKITTIYLCNVDCIECGTAYKHRFAFISTG